jgi:chromosome segregation ATPase
LKGFLSEVENFVRSGKVTVKSPDKILQRIDELHPELKERRETIVKKKEKLAKLRDSLKDSPLREAEHLQSTLAEKQNSKDEQKTLIEKKRTEINEIGRRMDELVAKIEAEVEETFNIKLKIQRRS